MSQEKIIFSAGRPLIEWNAEGLPVWQDWDLFSNTVLHPLIHAAERHYLSGIERGRGLDISARLDSLIASLTAEEDGLLRVQNSRALADSPLAPVIWGSAPGIFSLSHLMLFQQGARDEILRALSFLPQTMKGPLYRVGNWKVRDKLASAHAKEGGLALISDSSSFQLVAGDQHRDAIASLVRFVNDRWPARAINYGDKWDGTVPWTKH